MAANNKGYKVYISPEPVADADLTLNEFQAIDDWIEVSNVGTLPDRGPQEAEASYNTLANGIIKGKGSKDFGSGDLECRRVDGDTGQAAMITAALTDLNHAIRLVAPNSTGTETGDLTATTEYLRALVSGPRTPGGGDTDFPLRVFTLMINQSMTVEQAEITE